MLNLHIVTDSSAHFSNSPLPHNVTIVPNKLVIGGKTYREGVDITNEEAFRFINQANQGVEVIPPSVAEYTAVYERLTRHCDGIISLHPSREILDSWQNAQLAAQPFNGRCRIAVIDTQTLSGAQGMIVRLAAREAYYSWGGRSQLLCVFCRDPRPSYGSSHPPPLAIDHRCHVEHQAGVDD